MRLADRHILRELIPFFGISTLTVLSLLVGIALLFKQTSFEYLSTSLPYYLSLTLPVAIALAASLTVNRVARDHEFTILRAAGQSLRRSFLPILVVGALVSVGDYYLFDHWLPAAVQRQLGQNRFQETTTPAAAFAVDRYTIAYASSVRLSETRRRVYKLVLLETMPDAVHPRVLTAQSAEYEKGTWILHRVVSLTFDKNGKTIRERRTVQERLTLPVDFSNLYRRPDSAQIEYTFTELMHRSQEARRFGNRQDALAYEVDAWTKIALPAMAFVFTLFATPLALRFARTGSFSGVMLSIGTVFVAWNTLLFMQYVGYGGYLPPVVAVWATDALFAFGGLILLWRSE